MLNLEMVLAGNPSDQDLLIVADLLTEEGHYWEGIACRFLGRKGRRPLHRPQTAQGRQWVWFAQCKAREYPQASLPRVVFQNLPGYWGNSTAIFYSSATRAVEGLAKSLQTVWTSTGVEDILEEAWGQIRRLQTRRDVRLPQAKPLVPDRY